jgi:hypothetical protein
MATRNVRKLKNRKSRKNKKGGATPGSQDNLNNCTRYWHTFSPSKCYEKGRDGIPRHRMFDYPGLDRMRKGERPTLNGRLNTNY